MKISYAICVCNEHLELNSLLSFLSRVADNEDEINILVDSGKVTDEVRAVLKKFEKRIVVNERKFCGNFSKHRNYHITKCKGEYIFVLDADEIPQEALVKNIRNFDSDILYVPRMNIIPGYTEEWCKRMKFSVNEVGWINWPDYQGRYFRNNGKILWSLGLHERLIGSDKVAQLQAIPQLALWHVKSVEKQDKQDAFYSNLKEN
jgi:glycosyltransferase involved in cell wall biosynthesis